MYVGYLGCMGMLENGDHANFVLAFFRPHVTNMFVLNIQSQPQTPNARIIIRNQMVLNVVMPYLFAEAFRISPLSMRVAADGISGSSPHDSSILQRGREELLLA
jgi:hypothetical protein